MILISFSLSSSISFSWSPSHIQSPGFLLFPPSIPSLWEWMVSSLSRPAWTPLTFPPPSPPCVTKSIQRVRRLGTTLHHCFPDSSRQGPWRPVTARRTPTIWCTSSSFWWASALCCPGMCSSQPNSTGSTSSVTTPAPLVKRNLTVNSV